MHASEISFESFKTRIEDKIFKHTKVKLSEIERDSPIIRFFYVEVACESFALKVENSSDLKDKDKILEKTKATQDENFKQ